MPAISAPERTTSRPAPQPQLQTAEPPAPPAQWRDTRGDRWLYVFWLLCFALMAIQTLGDTLVGFLFGHH